MPLEPALLAALALVVIADLVRRFRVAPPPDYTKQSELERKAQEYDALEALLDQMERDFDAQLNLMANTAQHAQAALDLVSRDVPGARQYIATYFAQVADAKAQAKNTRAARNRNPARGASHRDTEPADLD